ncbi:MAG: NADH-quinone oxidoreductase subunit 5 family protein, partial [Vicinamibacteria bacterium]
MVAIPFEVAILFGAPLAALALGLLLRGAGRPQWTHLPMIASCLLVALSSLSLAGRVASGLHFDGTIATWIAVGDWAVPFGVRVDGLTASVLAMVSIVSGLIHVYAASYMKAEPGFSRFFLLFHLFFLAMIGLLLSNNYVQLYLFWELVGVASYFLIGFWYQKASARRAALQAFLANRVGDFGLMLATLLLIGFADRGGARFEVLFSAAAALDPWLVGAASALILLAASSKSAQFPLHFWLPDAMEGPTPVSALMHAATMVTAGIFVLARSWPLVSANPELLAVLMWVGGLTAIGSGVIAATETDLKRILAYSTVSHLGLMAFGLGLGQVPAAIFHLVTHGFFKASLFLTAGNIAHGLGRSTASIDEAGGLARR